MTTGARETGTTSLARALWAANADLAHAARVHPFVRGLGLGTLPLAAFRAYVAQDAYFLDGFVRAYALALAKCPDWDGLRELVALLTGALDELGLHAGYAQRWGIDLGIVTPDPATLAYTDFLLATAALGSVGETCAAMAPCMRLYAFLGQSLASQGAAYNPYHEWVQTYAATSFETLAATLERLVDRYADETVRVRDVYRRAMRLEIAFFDAHTPASNGDES